MPVGGTATVVARGLLRLLRRSWAVLRQSRLGMTGFIIVLIFAFMAILAPVISPYGPNFEAPILDRFTVSAYPLNLPQNLTYNAPVMGPTTPLTTGPRGGLWEINSAREGLIFMNFVKYAAFGNVSPYLVGNQSIRLDVTQDFGILPLPGTPLIAAYYIVPGTNVSQLGSPVTTGPGVENGLLAVFTGRTFMVVDPFTKHAYLNYTLPFQPIYTGEDPASAGQMAIAPTVRIASVGIIGVGVGPYRYLFASDGNTTALFEVNYCHTTCNDPAVPTPATSAKLVGMFNGTLSAAPLVYYNQEDVQYSSTDGWRAGPGEGLVLPLTNNTLAVYNVSGRFRGWVPLTLDGQPAVVDGSIGFTRSAYPAWLYLPLRSSSASGLGVFDMNSLRVLHTISYANPNLVPVGAPDSYRAEALYFAFYNQSSGTSHMLGLRLEANGTMTPIPQLQWDFEGEVHNYFHPPPDASPYLFIYGGDGLIHTMNTTYSTGTTVPPSEFAIIPSKGVAQVLYAGTPLGTIWGPNLAPAEMFGFWMDPVTGQTVMFQLLGTPISPLAPGKYPSGNTYLLGTDYKGGDIVTELFYGSQVAFVVGILAALFSVGIGTLVGLLSGYFGAAIDTLLMRTTDVFLVLPFLPVVLVLDQILRPSIWTIILVLGVLGWPGIARVVRSQVLTLKERPFVDAARVSGASDMRLAFLHIAPNILPFSFLYMSLTVSGAIITEAILSFLGLGDPTVISWGGMLSTVLTLGGALSYWWWLIPPGLCITFLSLGFYLLGRGFDEIINPRLRRR